MYECVYIIYMTPILEMFALLYLIFRRCAWMQYMKNGTFWNCWSGDSIVALCTKGPDFQQPRTSIPK